jgi:hypothetical protein
MRPLFVLGALAFLATGIGCGGGDDTVPAEVLSGLERGAFVDRADRICVQGRKRLIVTGNRYFGGNRKPSDAAVTIYAKREAIPILTRQYSRLRQLRPPAGDAREIDRILDLAERGIDELRSDPALLNQGSGVPPALERARRHAFLYGLGACGQPVETR